ncbi:MAG: threonine--tRNA ligase [Candidatus Parcubacteria bacterium]|nr:MAG: threonine--tRNA ligase [Candidatus Parcubacteria bacterium]
MKIDKLYKIRHSLAHLLATAILEIDPKAKFGIGPVTENGFYYDFLLSKKIEQKDLPLIENKIKELIKKNIKFERKKISLTKAKKFFKNLNQPFKLELINDLQKYSTTEYEKILDIKDKKIKPKKINYVTLYKTYKFIDLCRGGHVSKSSEINLESFKLTKIAGAHWRGNENNPMLTRIYGVAFETKEQLESYLKWEEEVQKRDHRILGQELELFTVDENVGSGLILWLPKGAIIRQTIQEFIIDIYKKNNYQLVFTPHITKQKLFEISGHLSYYQENMYYPIKIEGENYYLKPMNCPFHLTIYKQKTKSYRDLPIRYAELGTVYRYERSGTLSGLTRVRGFTQDDGHIICTFNQLPEEIHNCLNLVKFILEKFGFKDFKVFLSIWDKSNKKKYLGTNKEWQFAIESLKKSVEKLNWQYEIMKGEAAFYGPKIDVVVKDALGRDWQISTIQLDFNLTKKFDLAYIDKDNKTKKPYLIHRALLGSIERFIGLLIEHYEGNLPFWLSPIQIAIIPVNINHLSYAEKLLELLKEKNYRVKILEATESLSKRILIAEKEKIPYMIIIGDKEIKENKISIRKHKIGNIGTLSLNKFLQIISKEY